MHTNAQKSEKLINKRKILLNLCLKFSTTLSNSRYQRITLNLSK